MSSLQKTIMKNKLPPRIPRTSKLAPFGGARRKDYSPISWKNYFEKYVDVEIAAGVFRVYLSPEPDHPERPRIVTLHGGGYSGLSWALFTEEITSLIHCQVVSMDIRGHGETQAQDCDDLSIDTLVSDVGSVLLKLFGEQMPPLILLGHSMGGAIAVRASHLPALEPYVQGVVVIDVVEGTAMEALASMQSFLRSRPTHFKSIEHAVEWCVRSGQVRNVESARVSMPSQIVNCTTDELATKEIEDYKSAPPSPLLPTSHGVRDDVIAEESDEGDADMREGGGEGVVQGAEGDAPHFVMPSPVEGGGLRYRWRVDLSRSERHWSGWFLGLSAAFLSTRAPRLLLLASIEGLDRALTVGQMQGKFQMQVLTRCGHAVHEDSPAEVARVLAAFALRHRLTAPTARGEQLQLICAPGC
ncbi:protein phosphatase methylesterase 1-like [Maniola hyperantus]|uniref:protein phosphatase methylesterase 1-like n=1 Tax=Aphantopus hyperantus TaxID=2795564 RepID=UPI00156A67BF|nr:protein phosphatase methylesterase 1-like [Maniola hyperantus]